MRKRDGYGVFERRNTTFRVDNWPSLDSTIAERYPWTHFVLLTIGVGIFGFAMRQKPLAYKRTHGRELES